MLLDLFYCFISSMAILISTSLLNFLIFLIISFSDKGTHREIPHSQNACMLVAPTGVAAFNIDGLTIHYAFWLPVEHGNLTK